MNECVVVVVFGVIYGIGIDIIQIECVDGVMQWIYGCFVEKVLGFDELCVYYVCKVCFEWCGFVFFVMCFVVKEVVFKVIGFGMCWLMMWWVVQMFNLLFGQLVVCYSGELVDWIVQYGFYIQISVMDECDYVVVFVVVEL